MERLFWVKMMNWEVVNLSSKKIKPCVFEYIYFARPDSILDGKTAYEHRKNLGAELAKENDIDADIVVPVPDSGNAALRICTISWDEFWIRFSSKSLCWKNLLSQVKKLEVWVSNKIKCKPISD